MLLFTLLIAGVKRGDIVVFNDLGDVAFALIFLGIPPMAHIMYPFAPSPLRFALAIVVCAGFVYNFMISRWQNGGGFFKPACAAVARYLLSVYFVFGTASYVLAKPHKRTSEIIFTLITFILIAALISRWKLSDPFKYMVPSYVKGRS